MDLDSILKEFNQSWRAQAFMWHRKYLVSRKKYKNVLYQNRRLRIALFNALKDSRK